MKSFVFFSRSGCILPLLIIFNLFLGWIFFRPLYWLAIEATLILLFLLNSYILTRKIISCAARRDGAVDVQATIVEEKPKKLN
ncbi:MAG: hypothetical protein FJZ13_00505 [Candidatus Omnitrophica bacterium]|nr:hypothetical protein [Candidatus Omnitrophota bacterium]